MASYTQGRRGTATPPPRNSGLFRLSGKDRAQPREVQPHAFRRAGWAFPPLRHGNHFTGGGEAKVQLSPPSVISTDAIGGTTPSAPSARVNSPQNWRSRLGFSTTVTR